MGLILWAYSMGLFKGAVAERGSQYGGLFIEQDKDKFQNQNGGYCFSPAAEVFDQGLDNETLSKVSSNLEEIKSKDDVKLESSSGDVIRGCLVINGNTGSGNTWEGGNFRFVWTVSVGKTGFAVYMTGNTKDTNSVEFDGIAYSFKKEDKGGKTDKKLEIKPGNKTISDISKYFPQKNSSLSERNGIKNKYGEFLDDAGTKLKENSPYHGYSWWKFNSGQDASYNEQLQQGSSNLDGGWKHFFDDGNKGNMTDLIKNIKGQGH